MTRHKSRVARKNRRSARRGTRKQSGGINLFGLFGSKPTTDAGAQQASPVAAKPAAQPGFFSGILSIFKSKKPEPNAPVDVDTNNPATAEPQKGGRKTRHRRQSARRHHK